MAYALAKIAACVALPILLAAAPEAFAQTAPAITAHPPANFSITAGGSGSISVTASGTAPLSYQWQASNPIGYSNISNGGNYSGVTTPMLTLSNVGQFLTTTIYRCVVTNSTGTATSNGAWLTVLFAAPSFTQQPPSQTVATAGQTVTISAAATGIPTPTLQWERSLPGGGFTPLSNGGAYSGVTGGTLTLTAVTQSMSGEAFRCAASNGGVPVSSSPSTLTVNAAQAPTITTHPPANFSITVGGNGSISVSASGTAPLSYQWQASHAIGYSNISNGGNYSGVTTPTLTLSTVGQLLTTTIYRCVVTNSAGTATSNGAGLTVLFAAPTFTQQPPAQTVAAIGQTITISAAATGIPPPTLQWERSAQGGGFTPLGNGGAYSGTTGGTLTITAVTQAMSGDAFRCVAFNGMGVPMFSSASTLTVSSAQTPPTLTTHPPLSVSIPPGGNGTISVAAAGSAPLAFQWQISNPIGFANLSNGGVYTGANTPTLILTGVSQFLTTTQFRCVVTNAAGSVTSTVTTLFVQAAAPVFTSQPPAQLSASVGQTIALSAAATGSPTPTLQWERSVQGGAFSALSAGGGFSGVTTDTLTITAAPTMHGDAFRCIAFNGTGLPVASSACSLTVGGQVISVQPQNRSVTPGQSASFSVSISPSSTNAQFQWQRMPAGGATWANVSGSATYGGVTTDTLVVSGVTAAMHGDQFRVTVNRGATDSVTSSAATLTVSMVPLPVFAQQPSNASGALGQTVIFTVTVTGDPAPTLQWQVSTDNGGAWQNVAGATGDSLSVSNLTVSLDGRRYRAVASSAGGTATSTAATLNVAAAMPPTIASQPQGGTYVTGQSISLVVAVSGTEIFRYRWYKNGALILGATGASLAIPNVQEGDAGSYFVEVAGLGGSVSSQAATIVVQAPPRFRLQPVNATVEAGLNISFSAGVVGSPTPTLQWYARTGAGSFTALADAGPYSGANQPVLRLSSVGLPLDGLQVQVRATNAAGIMDSAIATLSVAKPTIALKIKTQPQSQTVKAGAPVRFHVEMEGAPSAIFQWRKDGAAIEGATQSAFALAAATTADSAGFSVVVRDSAGSIVTSNTASLTVVGGVDANFDPKGGPNDAVTLMIALSDGGYLAAGTFTRVAGVPRAGLARIRADGSLVNEFDPGTGASGTIRALVELAGGKFLVVGQFDRFNDQLAPGIVRLNNQGGVDPTFNPTLPVAPANDPVLPLERFHFAGIGLAGGGYLLGGQAGVVALSPTGAFIPASHQPANAAVFALLQQFNGGIIIGGDFTSLSGNARPRLARLLPDFRIDAGFDVGTGPNSTVQSLLRSPEGWIYVFGTFTSFNGRARPAGVARIGPTGALDLNYNPPLPPVTAAADGAATRSSEPAREAAVGAAARGVGRSVVQPNGGIVLPNGSGATERLAALDPSSGLVSPVFEVAVNGSVHALAISDNGGVAMAGDFTAIGGTARANVGLVSDDSAGSRVVNLSTRGRVSGGERNLILGFAIQGPEAMRVLIRGVGPTLRGFGITTPLARPQLTLFDSSRAVMAENRGWRTAADPADALALVMQQVGAFALSSNDDAALLLNLAPGTYTAQISGVSEGQGIALGEVYAVDQGRSQLVNLSVRGAVGTNDDVLIPAFVITGGSRLLLMRTIGPGLAQFNVSGILNRPAMELRRDGVLLQANQGWTTSFDPAAVQARTPMVGAFPLGAQSADAALLSGLAPGAYTVTARGADGGTGVALVEIYNANGIERPATVP